MSGCSILIRQDNWCGMWGRSGGEQRLGGGCGMQERLVKGVRAEVGLKVRDTGQELGQGFSEEVGGSGQVTGGA